MARHLWVLPWLSLVVGVLSLLVAILRTVRQKAPPESPPLGLRPLLPIWLILVAAGVSLELKVGAEAAVDYIGARGFVLGCLSGFVLVWLTRRSPEVPMTSIFGVALTSMSMARLWLTHGESTGLTAVPLGASLTVLCLMPGVQQGARAPVFCAQGLTLISTLSVAMQLGFSRAEEISKVYWPDVPVLAVAGIALGSMASTGLPSKVGRFLRPVVAFLSPGLIVFWMQKEIVHEATPLKVYGFGLVVFAVLFALSAQESQRSDTDGESVASGLARRALVTGIGLVLLFAASGVAFSYWAGYGVALLIVSGWAIAAAWPERATTALTVPLAIGMLICLHRVLTLQNSDLLGQSSITDTWNLLALCAGAMLPLAFAGIDRSTSSSLALRSQLAESVATLASIVVLSASVFLIGYLFATQTIDGIVVGAALAMSVLSVFRLRAVGDIVVTSIFLSFLVLQVMPLMGDWKEPPRPVRVEVMLAVTLVAAVIALVSFGRSRQASTATEA